MFSVHQVVYPPNTQLEGIVGWLAGKYTVVMHPDSLTVAWFDDPTLAKIMVDKLNETMYNPQGNEETANENS